MNVLAINSSPKMDKGNTALVLNPFLDGCREAGAQVEVLYTKQLDIKPCQGEFACWLKHPGECFQKDDMEIVRPKLADADIWVLATPVYVDAVTGPMKNLMDRLIPLGQPFIELREDHCRHPLREGAKPGQLVLVSTCGFWEMDNFDPVLSHIKAACKNMSREFAGALLRPHGASLAMMKQQGLPMEDVFDAAKEAGRQLVRDGKMAPDTLAVVSRELVPRDAYVDGANQYFRHVLGNL